MLKASTQAKVSSSAHSGLQQEGSAFLTAGHLGTGVLLEMRIQHCIADLVTDLICTRMNVCKNHRNIKPSKLKC